MTPETLTALQQSIEKWERIADGTGADEGPRNCALCRIFYWRYFCADCPVENKTGVTSCDTTPYEVWTKHHREAHHIDTALRVQCNHCRELAQAEIDFLRSLLPTENESKPQSEGELT